MNTQTNEEVSSIALIVEPQSAIDFMHGINTQHFGWDLNLEHARTTKTSMTFDVEQETTASGMKIVLNGDGTWHGEYTAKIDSEA